MLPGLGSAIVAGLLGPPTKTWIAHDFRSPNSTTHSRTGMSLGTPSSDRLIVCGVTGFAAASQTVVSATIGGISATVIVTRNSSFFNSIFAAPVPTGTTGDINITFSGTVQESSLGIYAVTGLSSFTALASGENGGSSPRSVALNGVNGAVIIGVAKGQTSSGYRFSAPAELLQDFVHSNSESYGSMISSVDNVTVTAVDAGNLGMAAAAFR
ncbi:MAG: hypothetical protein ABFD96_05965 [Armatimonadia bacterium]